MKLKFLAAAALMCSLPYALAGTNVIGTATARGDLRVDGYAVKGNATIFDGTVVETGNASAAIRLKSGAEVKLATNSRSQLFGDHLVLQRGSTELEPSNKITFEANGLHVTPNSPNSRGTVSINDDDQVEVAALTGQFRVTNASGTLLGSVATGKAMSFDPPQAPDTQIPAAATPKGPVNMSVYGTLTRSNDNHYYLNLPAPDLGYVYEVQGVSGSNLESFVGKVVEINGTVDVSMRPEGHANWVMMAHQITEQHISNPMSSKKKAILATAILGGAAGTAIGLYEANQNPAPASR